ncbi:zf-HC2 domain-containing protein [Microbacterium sp. HJ5]
MNPDHAHFAEWDAAYVLGSLSPGDRRAFEEHLATCEPCRAALADIAPTLGLLARVRADRAQSMLAGSVQGEGPDASRRARIVELGARESRRRRRGWWAGGLAAAAVLVVAVVLAVTTAIAPALRGIQVVALEPLADLPITATVELSDAAWGTRIEMICRYTEPATGDGSDEGWPYALVVTGVDGTTSEVSSWRAYPGSTARLSAGTSLDADEIAAVEIRSVRSGKVLLRTEVAPSTE